MHRSRTLAFTLAALLAASPLAASDAAEKDELYSEAQDALDEGRWARAADLFGRAAERGGAQADDALYWQAYALHKGGRNAEALAAARKLQSAYPKSAWVNDARTLEVEIRGAGGNVNPEQLADEELKLYAINSLMGAEPERAVPLLQKFLRGNHSLRLKEKALFVLSQTDSPEGRKTLLEIARSSQPPLQRKAIEYLGVSGDRAALREVYRSAGDPAMRAKVIEAMLVADDVEGLAALAREERDQRLRLKAIHTLGVTGGVKESGPILRSIYAASPDRETRMAVIEALFVQDNARALIEIFRSEKDPALKREAVQKLTLIDDPEADRFLESVLDE